MSAINQPEPRPLSPAVWATCDTGSLPLDSSVCQGLPSVPVVEEETGYWQGEKAQNPPTETMQKAS